MNRKLKSFFKIPAFIEYFNTFEDDVLIDMAAHHPETLKRMCQLISLDAQIEKESIAQKSPNINDYLA
tara:strand:+ start:393 stop:596 length:204 start_codon:yes stop_codon:yes gene_type:complete